MEKDFPFFVTRQAAGNEHAHEFERSIRPDRRPARSDGFGKLPEHATEH
jgi:hypothetical protein